jgi:hypothetical protein
VTANLVRVQFGRDVVPAANRVQCLVCMFVCKEVVFKW